MTVTSKSSGLRRIDGGSDFSFVFSLTESRLINGSRWCMYFNVPRKKRTAWIDALLDFFGAVLSGKNTTSLWGRIVFCLSSLSIRIAPGELCWVHTDTHTHTHTISSYRPGGIQLLLDRGADRTGGFSSVLSGVRKARGLPDGSVHHVFSLVLLPQLVWPEPLSLLALNLVHMKAAPDGSNPDHSGKQEAWDR